MIQRRNSHNYYAKQVAALRRCYLFLAIGFLCSLFTGCSEDTAEELDGTGLPVRFTASVMADTEVSIKSRATVNNSWSGGESVAIRMNNTTKQYVAAADGGLTPGSGVTSHTWMSGSGTTVITAWSPYQSSMEQFTIDTGQSSAVTFQKNDYLYAYCETSYEKNIQLTFKHLTAKLIFHINSSEYVTDEEIKGGSWRIMNQTKTSGKVNIDGSVDKITATATDYQIAPLALTKEGYPRSGMALVVPQKIKGITFIQLAFGGKTFKYIPPSWMTFEAGYEYTYEINITQDALTVVTTGINPWVSDENDAEDIVGDVGQLKPTPSINPWTGTDVDLDT